MEELEKKTNEQQELIAKLEKDLSVVGSRPGVCLL